MRADRHGMSCQGCPRAEWARQGCIPSKPVYGAGSLASGLAFVGEAPALTELFHGEPLRGPTGWNFKYLLADAGLAFDDVYRTNAVLCAAGKGAELGRDWPAVGHCAPSLLYEARELVKLGIRAFVAMGNAALQGLLPGSPGIAFARGYVYPWSGNGRVSIPDGGFESHPAPSVWVVPTLHPSPKNLKGKGSGWALIVNDILKAKRLVARGPQRAHFVRILAPTITQVFTYFYDGPRPIVVDVENTKAGQLVCVGFCDGQDTLVVPKLQQGGREYWPPEDWKLVVECVGGALATWPTRFQNGAHDVTVLEGNGFRVGNWDRDTMLMHAAVYPDQLHSLHHLGSLYREAPPWKPYKRRREGAAAEELD